MANKYKLLAQRIGLIGAVNFVLILNALILLPVLTKKMPVSEYGVWIEILATIGLVSTLSLMGLPFSLVRFLAAAKERDKIREIFYSLFFIALSSSLVISTLIFLLSKEISSFLFEGNVAAIKIAMAIIPLANMNEMLFNYFRAVQQIKRYSAYMLLKTSLNMIFISFLIFSGFGLLGAEMGYLASELTACILMLFHMISKIGFSIPRFENIREYLGLGLYLVPGSLSSWAVNSSNRYIIGFLLGASFVGYYSPGYNLGIMLNMIMAPFGFILPSILSKYYDELDIESVKVILEYSLKYFLALTIPAVFGLSLLSKPILMLLSTQEIASQGYMITPFVAVSSLMFGAYTIISHIIIVEKRTKILSIVWLITGIVNVALNILLVIYMGIVGAAIATLISYALALVLTTHCSFKCFRFKIDVIFLVKSMIASAIMSLVLLKWYPEDKLSLLAIVAFCMAIYVLALLALGGFKREEVSFFKGVLRI